MKIGVTAFIRITTYYQRKTSGNPIVVLMTGAPLSFLLTPVLAGSIVIVVVAWCLNNTRHRGSYPKYWW